MLGSPPKILSEIHMQRSDMQLHKTGLQNSVPNMRIHEMQRAGTGSNFTGSCIWM
jgi:hypothetical protein